MYLVGLTHEPPLTTNQWWTFQATHPSGEDGFYGECPR